jgi:putative transposase
MAKSSIFYRDRQAAARFFRKLLKRSGRVPHRLVTDRLGSYRAAHRAIMPSVAHDTTRYANNRSEVSHQPTRRRERHMRRFKSAAQAQRFLAVHGVVRNLFTIGDIGFRRTISDSCVRAPSLRGTQ